MIEGELSAGDIGYCDHSDDSPVVERQNDLINRRAITISDSASHSERAMLAQSDVQEYAVTKIETFGSDIVLAFVRLGTVKSLVGQLNIARVNVGLRGAHERDSHLFWPQPPPLVANGKINRLHVEARARQFLSTSDTASAGAPLLGDLRAEWGMP